MMLEVRTGKETSEYTLTKWSNLIGGVLVLLAAAGYITMEEAKVLAPIIGAAVVLGLAVVNSSYSMSRAKVKAAEAEAKGVISVNGSYLGQTAITGQESSEVVPVGDDAPVVAVGQEFVGGDAGSSR